MPLKVTPDVLNLNMMLYSGQMFNWYYLPPSGYKIKNGYEYALIQTDNEILIQSNDPNSEEFLARYFRLDAPVSPDSLPDFYVLRECYKRYRGIQILRQDPLRCMLSFIISQRMTIERIISIVHHLEEDYFLTPEFHVEQLLDIDWDKLKLGFRTEYLKTFCAEMNRGDNYKQFLALKDKSTEEIISILDDFPGVGHKIANCVALFGFDKQDAFPVDLWIERALKAHPELEFIKGTPYAGIVQQYMYMGARDMIL